MNYESGIFTEKIQVSTRLATITEGSPTNSGGLGVTFTGDIMDDGYLYFKGSSNGLRESIWRTDGTVDGTSRVLQEGNQFGGNWNQVLFHEQGVFIYEGGSWYILNKETLSTELVSTMPSEKIRNLQKVSDDLYYFNIKRNDQIVLFSSNSTFTEVNEIGEIHEDTFPLFLSAGTEGASIFSPNSFLEDTPTVYLKESNEILLLEDYLSTLSISVNSITYAYIRDQYMFISYKDENNFFIHQAIDMTENTVHDIDYINEPIEYFDFEDDLIIVTEREVVAFDKIEKSMRTLYDGVFGFTPIRLINDKLYFLTRDNSSFSEKIVEVDLTNDSNRELEGANTGNFFYNSKFEFYNNEFYYIGESDYQILYKYDFVSNSPVLVDTLSERTGATVVHALREVNNELVISKRVGFLQHEPYVLGDGIVNNLQGIETEEVKVRPTVSSNMIYVDVPNINSKSLIYSADGTLISTLYVNNKELNISSLKAGSYFGILETEDKRYMYRFIKI